mmetsp:Transcript_22646/g.67904  ORF Transcript_22646/g.67904 Transcript_22646/m.67904 type:complete len:267 (+) Transcript_22646:587-1387(+)
MLAGSHRAAQDGRRERLFGRGLRAGPLRPPHAPRRDVHLVLLHVHLRRRRAHDDRQRLRDVRRQVDRRRRLESLHDEGRGHRRHLHVVVHLPRGLAGLHPHGQVPGRDHHGVRHHAAGGRAHAQVERGLQEGVQRRDGLVRQGRRGLRHALDRHHLRVALPPGHVAARLRRQVGPRHAHRLRGRRDDGDGVDDVLRRHGHDRVRARPRGVRHVPEAGLPLHLRSAPEPAAVLALRHAHPADDARRVVGRHAPERPRVGPLARFAQA